MITEKVKNVITAGRCISAKGDAWEVSRVIPVASLTGQAAGTAAYLAKAKRGSVCEIDIGDLQESLQKTGIKIHIEEGKQKDLR